ncbi:unnamed protein product [Colias eurytheme]|nr:unnamed protein product [Colias eurytheme]
MLATVRRIALAVKSAMNSNERQRLTADASRERGAAAPSGVRAAARALDFGEKLTMTPPQPSRPRRIAHHNHSSSHTFLNPTSDVKPCPRCR